MLDHAVLVPIVGLDLKLFSYPCPVQSEPTMFRKILICIHFQNGMCRASLEYIALEAVDDGLVSIDVLCHCLAHTILGQLRYKHISKSH